jgi:hypothetical protein
MIDTKHPGDSEARAAIAGMTAIYGYSPAVGDAVRCERPFKDDFATGTVVEVNAAYVLVEIDGERLAYYPNELEYVCCN